jgi:hypothetical protein
VNNRTQTMQPPPTTTTSATTPRFHNATATGQHFKKATLTTLRSADPSGLPTGRRLHKPFVVTP